MFEDQIKYYHNQLIIFPHDQHFVNLFLRIKQIYVIFITIRLTKNLLQ